MRSSFAVFNVLLKNSGLVIFLTALATILATAAFAGFFKETPKPNNQAIVLVVQGLIITMSLLLSWAQRFGKLIRSGFNHLKVGFNQSIWVSLLMMISVFLLIPSFTIMALGFGTPLQLSLVVTIAVFCTIITIISSIAGAILMASTVLYLTTELARVEKNPGSAFFDFLTINPYFILAFILVLSLIILQLYIQTYGPNRPRKRTAQTESNEEISLRLKKPNALTSFFDRGWIQVKYQIGRRLGTIRNAKDIALLSGQYQTIAILRGVLLLTFVTGLFYQPINEIVIGFIDGFQNHASAVEKEAPVNLVQFLLVMLLSVLASYDTSLLTKVHFAQRYLWLKLPVDGFSNFKRSLMATVLKSSLVEVTITFLIFWLILRQSSLTGDYYWVLISGFFAFKFYSAFMGVLLIRSKVSHLIYFLVTLGYGVFFAAILYLTATIEFSDSLVLSGFSLVMLMILGVCIYRFSRQSILNT
ncbi:MAG: hypothetical protein HWE13_08700 [Gammaproteobacteria bacterium]|nr:hypothetical protein [Gammaproteobacteria bacterium]